MPTFNPTQTITLIPSGVINSFRFVAFDGAQAVAGQAARGISHDGAAVTDKSLSVITLGTAIVEAGDAFDAGSFITSDVEGRAIAVTDASGEAINAIAIGAAEAEGDMVEVIVVPPIVLATMARAEAQEDSVAADAAGIVADFNALLAKLRTAGIIAQ